MNSARFQKKNSLVRRILTGSRVQGRLLRESEESEKGIQKARPPKTLSTAQAKEFEVIKSKLLKRNARLAEFYTKLGITKEHFEKRSRTTPFGKTAEELFQKLTNWKVPAGKVELIPTPTALVFLLEQKEFMQLSRNKFSAPAKYAYFDSNFPGIIVINKRLWSEPMLDKRSGVALYGKTVLEHELEHIRQTGLRISEPVITGKTKTKAQRMSAMHKTSLTLSAKISAEIAANLRDTNFAKYFRKRYRRDSKDIAELSLDKKEALAFMQNEGNFLKNLYKDTRKAIDVVERARRAYLILPNGQRVRALSNEELVNIINNIGNVRRLVQRLPQLVEEAKKQKLAKRN